MRRGDWYLAQSSELVARHEEVADLLARFNELRNTDAARAAELLAEILPDSEHVPEAFSPLFLEYGHVTFGEGCFLNTNTVILDIADVSFGDRVLVGPNCQFITASHPVNDVEMRRNGWENGTPIRIGDDCWFGASVIVMPGVSIGDRCVLGAGTLVTKDIPDDSLVLGSPGRVVRTLNQDDDVLERTELPDDAPLDPRG